MASIKLYSFLCTLCILCSCSSETKKEGGGNLKGEYIFRYHDEFHFRPPAPRRLSSPSYPWENAVVGGFPRITKEYFRCKGEALHPLRTVLRDNQEPLFYRDCAGDRHGLPLRGNQEFIYPCLIHILNSIQEQAKKKVVITCGHRCPQHNAYADHSPSNRMSKHLIGAEVDFYVEGMESEPEKVVEMIQSYYRSAYANDLTRNSRQPRDNKEIFIKIYGKEEGRDMDNQHPYPYISIQVRYDRDTDTKVVVNPGHVQNFLRG